MDFVVLLGTLLGHLWFLITNWGMEFLFLIGLLLFLKRSTRKYLNKKWNDANKILKNPPARTIDFYNNIISGMIGGAIIYYLILLENTKNFIIGFWFIPFLFVLGLFVITKVIENSPVSKKKHLKNYCWNILAALIGGFWLIGIFNWSKIISTLILIISFIFIMILRNKYLKY